MPPSPAQSPDPPPPALPEPPAAPPPEPTAMDNLLAVAELELGLQAGAPPDAQYAFRPEEEIARDVMSFDLGEAKVSDVMFFDRKSHAPGSVEDDAFSSDLVHKELFESISEAHFLPELGGPHDQALLESLVEKGCEDNQVLPGIGPEFDKLAGLVAASGEFPDEPALLLAGGEGSPPEAAPAAPSSEAAEGLLHLRHLRRQLALARDRPLAADGFLPSDVFAPPPDPECPLDILSSASEMRKATEVNQLEYESTEKRLQNDGETADALFTEQVPDLNETYEENEFEGNSLNLQRSPEDTDAAMSTSLRIDDGDAVSNNDVERDGGETEDEIDRDDSDKQDSIPEQKPDVEVLAQVIENPDRPTDLSIMTIADDEPEEPDTGDVDQSSARRARIVPEKPRDLTIHGRMPTPVPSPRMLDMLYASPRTQPHMSPRRLEAAHAADRRIDILPVSPRRIEIPNASPRRIDPHASPRRLLDIAHASPRRIEIPRAPSRESDAMQSPQPSGIPAISSPEVFHPPPLTPKNKTQSILEAMFTSSSPKNWHITSEVSITKHQNQKEPLNLGKHPRKSASPTVSSCSEERSSGEPLEKRQRRGAMDELYQITQLLAEKKKKIDKSTTKNSDHDVIMSLSALKQFQNLKSNKNFNIPDPLLIPKDRYIATQLAPGKEIPALLIERPELRYCDDLDEERDRDILVISVREFEDMLIAREQANRRLNVKLEKNNSSSAECRSGDRRSSTPTRRSATPTTTAPPEPHSNQGGQPRPIPSMGALAEDIDAATSATFNPMMWMQYQHQMEAVAACSQNAEFIKALSASGYASNNYGDLSQMLLGHPGQMMNPASFPMMPAVDYDRMQIAIWQQMMLQKLAPPRRKTNSETQIKDTKETKPSEFQSPYVHSTNKGYQGRSHTSARTSPITNNYSSQRAAMQHPFLQGLYGGPAMGAGAGVRSSPNLPPNVPMAGLNVPYFNPSMSQRSPRAAQAQHKSPTPPSPSYFANNNYLSSVREKEATARAAHSPADAARPRISVKKVDELRRRRDDAEVGSTTPLGEQPHLPPDSSASLWHPLFSNQKNYPSPWSWTTVTATGD